MSGLLLITIAAVVTSVHAIPSSVAPYRAPPSLSQYPYSEEPLDDAMDDFTIQPWKQQRSIQHAACLLGIYEGQTWKNDCNTCICLFGRISCTTFNCRPVGCWDGFAYHNEGQAWKKDCNTCQCSMGEVTCTTFNCRPVDTTCQCGVTNVKRIIGGTEVNPKHKYPWHVGLVQPRHKIQCGGSIINDRWILTAAHCVTHNETCRLNYGPSSGLQVVVGEHNQADGRDDVADTKKYNIKTYLVHPSYSYNCERVDYDFALLELSEPITFNSVIRPICLPKDDTKTYAGLTGIVTGWGAISNNGDLSTFLKEVIVPIRANNDCKRWGILPAWKMCVGGLSDKDSCSGDSGGPLHVVENGKYVQVGVVSYGRQGAGCASTEYPTVYARVSKVLPWISENTSNGKKCD